MKETIEKQEASVEREMQLLRRYDHPAPDAALMGVVARAMQTESRRLGKHGATAGTARVSRWAMAAAVLLAFGLAWSGRSSAVGGRGLDAGESLAIWSQAVDASTAAVTQLLAPAERSGGSEADAQRGIDDFSDAFDSTFGTGA